MQALESIKFDFVGKKAQEKQAQGYNLISQTLLDSRHRSKHIGNNRMRVKDTNGPYGSS